MPCLTHAFTRQPVAEPGSGAAARTSPFSIAVRRERNAVIAASSPIAAGPAAKCRSMIFCNCAVLELMAISLRVYQLLRATFFPRAGGYGAG